MDNPFLSPGESMAREMARSCAEDHARAEEVWTRIEKERRVAFEAGRRSRDSEVDYLVMQRDLLAAYLDLPPTTLRRVVQIIIEAAARDVAGGGR
jgi:hypothetical protein